jgi:hypothetical protein
MPTPTYDPQRTIATWAGILFQGEMDGEHYSLEFQEDRNTLYVGSKGFTTLVKNANESAIFTAMLAQTSPANNALSAAYAANLKGPFLMKDLDTLTLAEGDDAVIQKMTPIKRGKELVAYEWKILIPKCIAFAGGAL